jgi:DNA-binding LytR/AlgR family response regulator
MPDALRVLIVDDEPLARDCVRLVVGTEPDVDVVGECGDGAQAASAIREPQPESHAIDEADGNYVVLHAGAARHRLRESLRGLVQRLDPAQFAQAHRSAIVNLTHVRELQAWFSGEYIAVMRNGEEIRVSRTYAPRMLRTS